MNLIVAADRKWGIGRDGGLLASIPTDMKYFKEHTMGKVVVMGRRTLESMPGRKGLPGRINYVLTSDPDFSAERCVTVNSIEALREDISKYDPDDVFVIGGATLYDRLYRECDRLYVTKIDADLDADTFITDFSKDPDFEIESESEPVSENGLTYRFAVYRKKRTGMDRKLVFLDVDGTLTPPGGYEPPESALRAIRKARENGHKVFLCSGRNYCMLEPLFRFGFDGCIASCGGQVYADGKVLYDCPMTEEQKNRVMTLFRENGVYVTIESSDASFYEEEPLRILEKNRGRKSHVLDMIKAVWIDLGATPMSEYDGRPVYKMVFVCRDDEQIRSAEEELGDGLMFIIHDFSEEDLKFGEVLNRKSGKGDGVRLIAEHLGVSMENTIGFGDSMLDTEMIEAVGTSVCMDNGSPRLKEMSDMVCPSVYDDGIEWAFRELGLI